MAKVTIILEDTGDSVNIQAHFEPAIKTGEECTDAQAAACKMLEALKEDGDLDILDEFIEQEG